MELWLLSDHDLGELRPPLFDSFASDLAEGDTNKHDDVFAFDPSQQGTFEVA